MLFHRNMLADQGLSEDQWLEFLVKVGKWSDSSRKQEDLFNANYLTLLRLAKNPDKLYYKYGRGVCHGGSHETFRHEDLASYEPLVTFTALLGAEALEERVDYTQRLSTMPWNEDELKRYFAWLTTDSPYAEAFIPMDPEWMINFGTITRLDVDGRMTLAAFMLTRYAHEFRSLIHVWDTLVTKLGADPRMAFIFAHLVDNPKAKFQSGDPKEVVKWRDRVSTGHNAIYTRAVNLEFITKFLNYQPGTELDNPAKSVQVLRGYTSGAYWMFRSSRVGSSKSSELFESNYFIMDGYTKYLPEDVRRKIGCYIPSASTQLPNPFKPYIQKSRGADKTTEVTASLETLWQGWCAFIEAKMTEQAERTTTKKAA